MTWQSILRAAVIVSLLATVSGCLGPQPDRWADSPGPPPGRQVPPPPNGFVVRPVPRTEPVGEAAVVPAAYAEPEPPGNTFAAAQPQLLPQPRPVAPEPKPGSEPPAAPKVPPPILGAASSVGGPLALDEVLFSVERNYPLLRAIEQERAIAGGRLVSTMGAFDLNLTAGADEQGTTYDNFRGTVGVSQGLPVGGVGRSRATAPGTATSPLTTSARRRRTGASSGRGSRSRSSGTGPSTAPAPTSSRPGSTSPSPSR